jgi:uncharacterized protein involved in outer membrane biogenesis
MKAALKVTSVIIVLVIAGLVGLTIFVKTYFTSDRLKGLIIPRIKEYTGREVGIEQINLSIFRGVVVKGLSIKEQSGDRDFISARQFILDYSFWPLLRKQLVINKIDLDSPVINIIRTKQGAYNFSDILKKPAAGIKGKPVQARRGGLPLTVAADKILVNDARASFLDETGRLPQVTANFGMDFKLRLTGMTQSGVQASGDINIKNMKTAFKNALIDTSGKISIGDEIKIDLDSAISGDKVKISGVVKDYLKSPDARVDVTSSRLDLDKLALIMAGMGKGGQEASAHAAAANKEKTGPPPGARAAGRISIGTAQYKAYQLKNVNVSYSYTNGAFALNPVKTDISGGDAARVSGNFSGNISASSTANAEALKRTLSGKGVLNLASLALKSTKLTELVASITGIPELNNPAFANSVMNFEIKDQKIFLNGYLNSSGLQVNPINGDVGFNKQLALNVTLKLSPALSTRMPGGSISQAFRNPDGWTVLPLKFAGTTDRPSVGLEQSALQKAAGKTLQRKLLEKLREKTGGGQEGQGQKPEDILKQFFK